MKLFDEKVDLALPDSKINYYSNFLNKEEADFYFHELKSHVSWRQDEITVYGKTYQQPRLTALYATNVKPYSYSNVTMHPHEFDGKLSELKQLLETKTKITFTTCLLNFYRNGKDSNGWHSDDEKELGENPIIASISLGEERFFHLRHKYENTLKQKVLLEHGSLLLMQGKTQHFWQHQIPKTSKVIGERINLTFRIIK
jgi:alkylated DNA repair dioxygenase AlkB